MGAPWFTMRPLLSLLFLFVVLSAALKFDISTAHGQNERCIRNFVGNDQLVMVTAIVSGQRGDGQKLNMHVRARLPLVIQSCYSLDTNHRQTHRFTTPLATNTAIARTSPARFGRHSLPRRTPPLTCVSRTSWSITVRNFTALQSLCQPSLILYQTRALPSRAKSSWKSTSGPTLATGPASTRRIS